MKRTQIMLEPAQYEKLVYISSQTHKSMSNLIRIAMDRVYKRGAQRKTANIVKRMAKMNLPVSSWENIEKHAEERYGEGAQL